MITMDELLSSFEEQNDITDECNGCINSGDTCDDCVLMWDDRYKEARKTMYNDGSNDK